MINGIMLTQAIIFGLVSRIMYVCYDIDMPSESALIGFIAVMSDVLSLSVIFLALGKYYGFI